MPQDRAGPCSARRFARYQRSEQAPVLALMEVYVAGVSTRKVAGITEVLCGTTFPKGQVSEVASALDTDLAA